MLFSVLAFTACTKPDRNDEAAALSKEIVNNGLSDVEHSVERVHPPMLEGRDGRRLHQPLPFGACCPSAENHRVS